MFKYLKFIQLINFSLIISNNKIAEIFCSINDFCKVFEPALQKKLIGEGNKHRNRAFSMSMGEILTITVLFHRSGYRTFNIFIFNYVKEHLKDEFPVTVSYNRFTELMQSRILPLVLYLKTCRLGECTGISFVDSPPIRVCNNKRINANKVFKDIAHTGRSTMEWFHGFKLHLLINDKGELLDFMITRASKEDRIPLKQGTILKKIFGSLNSDKGYISKELVEMLFDQGLHLVTGIRNNMRNVLMGIRAKIPLPKRSVIETINDQLKNITQAKHSRHRSFGNFLTNLVASLIAYLFQ